MKGRPEHRRLGLWALLGLLLCSCGRPVEGCLDIRAVNFQADADRDCCCEWPSLSFNVNHRVGESNHDPSAAYANALGQAWRMPAPVLLLSGFRLHFAGQPALPLLDTMLLVDPNGPSSWWRRDQVILDRDVSRFTAGRFIGSGYLDSVTFLIGLAPGLEAFPPDRFPEGHPLRSDRFGLWEEGAGYSGALARFLVPPMEQDTQFWRLHTPLPVTIPVGQDVITGRNVEWTITIDYRQWFEAQDLSGASPQPGPLWPLEVRASVD